MKRNTRSLPDVDLRGRVRRVLKDEVKLTKITLVGGPFGHGWLDVDLEVKNDMVQYGGWLWSWAGKKTEKGRRIFAKMPTERGLWRFIHFLIGKNGKDPRIQERQQPFVHTDETRPVKHGRGALKRAARHAA
jgi:hypothetical protein